MVAIETDCGILLTPYDPETEAALAIAAELAGTYRNALRELGKRFKPRTVRSMRRLGIGTRAARRFVRRSERDRVVMRSLKLSCQSSMTSSACSRS